MATYLKSASIQELWALYKSNFADIGADVTYRLEAARSNEGEIAVHLGQDVADLDVLEVGAGQRSAFRYLLGAKNRYTGIDIEAAPSGRVLTDFMTDLNRSGMSRAAKNALKNVSGVSRKYEGKMLSALGIDRIEAQILEMDAAAMTFGDESFDVVVSHNVFEHLPDPGAVMAEIARVLRPGGVAHIHTHLYTSDSGAHDPRLYGGERNGIPYWAHLRSDTAHLVNPNCYVNKLRLDDYLSAFDANWPGAVHTNLPSSDDLKIELQRLRGAGALDAYRDEELLTNILRTVWRKPRQN